MGKKNKEIENQEYDGEQPIRYSKYSANTKNKLIRLVHNEGMKIHSAAKQCKMNPSTAKMSLKAYRDRFYREHGFKPPKFQKKNKNKKKQLQIQRQKEVQCKKQDINLQNFTSMSSHGMYVPCWPLQVNYRNQGFQIGFFVPFTNCNMIPNQND